MHAELQQTICLQFAALDAHSSVLIAGTGAYGQLWPCSYMAAEAEIRALHAWLASSDTQQPCQPCGIPPQRPGSTAALQQRPHQLRWKDEVCCIQAALQQHHAPARPSRCTAARNLTSPCCAAQEPSMPKLKLKFGGLAVKPPSGPPQQVPSSQQPPPPTAVSKQTSQPVAAAAAAAAAAAPSSFRARPPGVSRIQGPAAAAAPGPSSARLTGSAQPAGSARPPGPKKLKKAGQARTEPAAADQANTHTSTGQARKAETKAAAQHPQKPAAAVVAPSDPAPSAAQDATKPLKLTFKFSKK